MRFVTILLSIKNKKNIIWGTMARVLPRDNDDLGLWGGGDNKILTGLSPWFLGGNLCTL